MKSLSSLFIPECIFTQWKRHLSNLLSSTLTASASPLMKAAPNLQSSPWPFNGCFPASSHLFSAGEPAQHWTQNSTCDFTRAGLRGKIISIILLNNFHPSVAQGAVCLLCDTHGHLPPRAFSAKLHTSQWATSMGWCLRIFLPGAGLCASSC